MVKLNYPVIACLLVIGLLEIFPSFALATVEQNKRQQLQLITQQIQGLQANLQQEKLQRQHVQLDLRRVEISIGDLSKQIEQSTQEIAEQTAQLQQLNAEKLSYQLKLAKQREMLAKQVTLAYQLGEYEYLKLFLNQENIEFLSRAFIYVDYLNQARLTVAQQLRQTLQQLQQVEQQIASHSQALEKLTLRDKQERTKLENYLNERRVVVGTLDESIATQDHRLASLLVNKRALEEVIQRLAVSTQVEFGFSGERSFAKQQGHLPWPIAGNIITHFGSLIAQSNLAYSGVLIDAQPGQVVRAISDGQVVFADWLSGFGLLMIVQHDGQYMTLYGHNQSLYKKTGDLVKHGELIATVGNSGGYYQSGLYFEIRHQGKPLNPERWCRKTGVLNYAKD